MKGKIKKRNLVQQISTLKRKKSHVLKLLIPDAKDSESNKTASSSLCYNTKIRVAIDQTGRMQ